MTDETLRRILDAGTEKDSETGCWLWTGTTRKDRNGSDYPVLRGYGGSRAARLVYEEFTGPIPHGKRVARSCGETLCLAPEHIIALTYAEERRLRKVWKGTEVEVQVDIRADGTAYVYTLTKYWEGHIRKMRGAQDLGNGEFLLEPRMFRFTGLRSHETIHQYVKNARARLGDAGDGHYARGVQERGWDKFKDEEEQFLGIAGDLDVG